MEFFQTKDVQRPKTKLKKLKPINEEEIKREKSKRKSIMLNPTLMLLRDRYNQDLPIAIKFDLQKEALEVMDLMIQMYKDQLGEQNQTTKQAVYSRNKLQ